MMKETNEVRIGRYLSGEAGSDEREAFEKELASDPTLKEEFLTFQRIWLNIPVGSHEQWDSGLAWQKFINSTQPVLTENIKTKRINLKWSIAAAIIIALGSFTLYWNQGKPVTYAYGDGKSDPVSLSDGSKIYLNKGATVDVYPFNRKKRRVALHGEAFFEVSPDAKRPCTVESGGTIAEVVGTSFNITQTSDNTRIFVQKGKVIFRSVKNEEVAVALTTGESAVFKGNRMQIVPNPSPNINAWHSKQLSFHNMAIAEVIADVSAYFNQEILLENEAVKGCRITNTLPFKEPEMSVVLNFIAQSINGTLKVEGNRCTILGGRCP